MGLRYQHRIPLGKGIHLNVSARGVGISAGRPGLRVGISSTGQTYSIVGAPGSGVSWTERSSGKAPRGVMWVPHGPEGHEIPMVETPHGNWLVSIILGGIVMWFLSLFGGG